MNIEELAQLPKESIVQLLEILRKDQRSIDGFWFLKVEESHGLERAVAMDASIWGKMGRINAKRLQRAFDLGEPGIPALIQAIELDPLWLFFGYNVEQISSTQAVVRFTDCLPQKGRRKIGKEVFPCRSVGEGYFTNFAKVIDSRIEVQCGFCPPEKYSEDLWCEWHFNINE